MSKIDVLIPNQEVIPEIQTNIFEGHDMARFAVGMLAIGDQIIPGREAEFTGYLRLRANVYADQTNMISKDLVREDGTERDEDDVRSVHFAIVENALTSKRVVAAMRLIIKSNEDGRPLPIEEFFPEVFTTGPAPMLSTEVSRYICRHESSKVQHDLKWPLYAAALSYAAENDLGPSYGVIEQALERGLKASRVPIVRIGEPKFVPEYNYDNLPVSIDTERLSRMMDILSPGMIGAMREANGDFVYTGLQKREAGGAVA